MGAAVGQYNAALVGHGSIAVKSMSMDSSMEAVKWLDM